MKQSAKASSNPSAAPWIDFVGQDDRLMCYKLDW
jgi:hypothetical protein